MNKRGKGKVGLRGKNERTQEDHRGCAEGSCQCYGRVVQWRARPGTASREKQGKKLQEEGKGKVWLEAITKRALGRNIPGEGDG